MALDRDRFDENRVDGFLDALGQGERPDAASSTDDALFDLLLGARSATEAAPFPEGPSEDDIDAAFNGGAASDDQGTQRVASIDEARERREQRRRGRRHGLSALAVGAASLVAVAVGSLSIMAFNAQPGDPLWNVNESIFGGESSNVDLVAALERDLAAANDALSRGDADEADRLLRSVSDRLDGVESAADRVNLIRIRDQIQRQLDRGQAGERGALPTPDTSDPSSGQIQPNDEPAPAPTTQTSAPNSELQQTSEPMPTGAPVPPPNNQEPVSPPPMTTEPDRSIDPVSPLDPTDMQQLRQAVPTQSNPSTPSPTKETSQSGNSGGGTSGGSDRGMDMLESPKTSTG